MAQELTTTSINLIRTCPHWNMYTAAKNRLASSLVNAPGVLDRLGRQLNERVQLRVAENRTTDTETLEFLSKHGSGSIRSAVAQNDNTRQSTVDSLADDVNSDVRYAMAANPSTSSPLLERLATDENPYVQERAQRTIARVKAEETLSTDQGA